MYCFLLARTRNLSLHLCLFYVHPFSESVPQSCLMERFLHLQLVESPTHSYVSRTHHYETWWVCGCSLMYLLLPAAIKSLWRPSASTWVLLSVGGFFVFCSAADYLIDLYMFALWKVVHSTLWLQPLEQREFRKVSVERNYHSLEHHVWVVQKRLCAWYGIPHTSMNAYGITEGPLINRPSRNL